MIDDGELNIRQVHNITNYYAGLPSVMEGEMKYAKNLKLLNLIEAFMKKQKNPTPQDKMILSKITFSNRSIDQLVARLDLTLLQGPSDVKRVVALVESKKDLIMS